MPSTAPSIFSIRVCRSPLATRSKSGRITATARSTCMDACTACGMAAWRRSCRLRAKSRGEERGQGIPLASRRISTIVPCSTDSYVANVQTSVCMYSSTVRTAPPRPSMGAMQVDRAVAVMRPDFDLVANVDRQTRIENIDGAVLGIQLPQSCSGGISQSRHSTFRTDRLQSGIDDDAFIAGPADNNSQNRESQIEIRAYRLIVRVHHQIRARLNFGDSGVSSRQRVRTGFAGAHDFHRDPVCPEIGRAHVLTPV